MKLNKSIIAFIDILGYCWFVKNHIDNDELIREIEKILTASIDLMQYKGFEITNKEDKKYFKEIRKRIIIRLISDSIIFTLKLPELNNYTSKYTNNENKANHVGIFFMMISMFIPYFLSKIGLPLRGGVSIGKHYEKEFSTGQHNNLFIFSEAYINAVRLERKGAKVARIVIDPQLLSFFKEISFNTKIQYFYKDFDNKICLDMFSFLENDNKSEDVLMHIKKAITLQIELHKNDTDIMIKLIYFAKRYNKKIQDLGFNRNDLFIELGI